MAEDERFEIAKVNHAFLDHDGRTADEPGDFVSKARYQRKMSSSPELTGMRFHIHWRAPVELKNFTVKLEVRGLDAGSGNEIVETLTKIYPKTENHSGWAIIDITDNTWKKLGKLMAWRVTLLQDGEEMTAKKSFTWDDAFLTSHRPTENK
jgi:hypothetical protein